MLNIRDNFVKSKQDKIDAQYEIALVGNPNVGKSTIFNALTGMKQHTGNWTGKTVSNAFGYYKHNQTEFRVADLPGIYSLCPNSEEESIANSYIVSNSANCIIVVVDATNIERNLNLVLQILNETTNVVLCINLYDEAEKSGIYIDTEELSLQLGIPVVCTCARKKSSLEELKNTVYKFVCNEIKTFKVKSIADIKTNDYESYIEEIYSHSKQICEKCVYTPIEKENKDRKLDRILTRKSTGIPVMLLLLGLIFWITIVGANYISDYLYVVFDYLKSGLVLLLDKLEFGVGLKSFIVDGVYSTLTWVVAVMLPPMAIFFPVFSLLEDSGFLPRIAFNLDGCFNKSGAHGKQALTMAMGFGCNACGVIGCRIIDSQREKNIAVATNGFIPCNGKLPSLIAIISIFIAATSVVFLKSIITAGIMLLLIILAVVVTLITSKLLSKTAYKGQLSSFMLELPPYRKPQFLKTIIYALKDRASFVLIRAVTVAIPAGAIIWCMSNIKLNDISLLNYCTDFLDPFGRLFGIDGVIVMGFILGFPANETVIPIILMAYTSGITLTGYASVLELGQILINNGWTTVTAICFIVLCLFHFPCSTTCLTILKETKSIKTTLLSMAIPTIIGLVLCLTINGTWALIELSFVSFA